MKSKIMNQKIKTTKTKLIIKKKKINKILFYKIITIKYYKDILYYNKTNIKK